MSPVARLRELVQGRARVLMIAGVAVVLAVVALTQLGGGSDDKGTIGAPPPGVAPCTKITSDELLTLVNAGSAAPAALRGADELGDEELADIGTRLGAQAVACRYTLTDTGAGQPQTITLAYFGGEATTVRDRLGTTLTAQGGVAATPVPGGDEAFVYEAVIRGVRVPYAAWVRSGDASVLALMDIDVTGSAATTGPTLAAPQAAQRRAAVLQLVAVAGQRL